MNEAFALLPANAICDRDFLFVRIDEILTSNTDPTRTSSPH